MVHVYDKSMSMSGQNAVLARVGVWLDALVFGVFVMLVVDVKVIVFKRSVAVCKDFGVPRWPERQSGER